MLEAQINLNGPACELRFTSPSGCIRRERNFYRDVWKPTQEASGLDIRLHECRHSYVTNLRAAGVNDADLAETAGHRVETMLARYTHPIGLSLGRIRAAISRCQSPLIPRRLGSHLLLKGAKLCPERASQIDINVVSLKRCCSQRLFGPESTYVGHIPLWGILQ